MQDEERELSLLKTLGVILGIWEGIQWLANCVGYSFDGKWQFINLIIGLLNLYFHFQFITNLASIAKKHQQDQHDGEDGEQLLFHGVFSFSICCVFRVFSTYTYSIICRNEVVNSENGNLWNINI